MRATALRQGLAAPPSDWRRDASDPRRPVARTCSVITLHSDAPASAAGPSPLAAFRSVPAYVLLGDPGSGKTTEFRRECEELRDTAVLVTARSLVADVHSAEKLEGRTLFIDGLDEMRAGATDARVPLDEIRRRLVRLGCPSFRLSCREADWLGPNDRRSLEEISPDSTIIVLLLDQLSDEAKRELLAEQVGVDDARSFEDEANRRGLGAMLGNPQALKLLADAVGLGGDWPESRLATLDLACSKMAAEHNDEHRNALPGQPTEATLDAAGHLCALLLLCGFEGYILAPGGVPADAGAEGLVPLHDLGETPGLPRELLKGALSTKLFRPGGETGLVPRHRLIAEFLAGRHLARLIEGGLPARRVVALMTGPSDGRVVTVLRGLSAWLAAHRGGARRLLIDADPLGVGLYGDIGGFTRHERERMLGSLVEFAAQGPLFGHARQDDRSLGYGDDTARTFRSLASADMLEPIRSVLRTPVGHPRRDRTTAFMAAVLSEAEESEKETLIPLVPELRTIMRDPDRPPWVTARALDAYIHIAPQDGHNAQVLVEQLNAIRDGRMPDPGEGMRVTLLEHLYPSVIGAAEVWRCGLPRPGHNVIGSLSSFWHLRVLPEYPDERIAELLDALSEDAQHLVPTLAHSYLDDLPVQLLARGLRAFGDTLDMDRLFGWLDVAGDSHRAHNRNEDDPRFVRTWLESHPQVQEAVFLLWLRRQLLDEPDRTHRFWACDALHRSKLPENFGLWCLEQAAGLENDEPALARALLSQAYDALVDPSIREGLTPAVMRVRIGRGMLAGHLEELCDGVSSSRAEDDEWHRRLEEHREQRSEERRQRQEDWATNLRAELDDLRNNRFFAPSLHTLAQVYLGIVASTDRSASPRQRIRDFIGDEEVLVEAVMAAIREAVFRDDAPTVDETVSLHSESKHSWLAYPVLASLHLLGTEDPDRLDGISDCRKREALAILYCVSSDEGDANWHERWFKEAPELVLEVLYQCAAPALRAGAEFVPCLNTLGRLGSHDVSVPVLAFGDGGELPEARLPTLRFDGQDDMVHDTRLRLLDALPSPASNKQMGLFDDLLARTIQHPDKTALRNLARKKLSLKSLGIGQRTRWLAVDALLSGRTNLGPLKEYVSQNEVRVRHLAEFLHRTSRRDDMRQSALASVREPEVLKDAIEILGPSFGPVEWGGWITLGMEMSELLAVLIAQLGTLAGDDTDRAFRDLIDDPRLERWHDRLVSAHERQHVVRRDASYHHPGIAEVQRTLSRGAPANSADLAALLQDRFDDIAADVQGSDSNPWKKYWNVDPHGRPTETRPENSCRDVLVEALRDRLPAEVTLAPEGLYAADNRADIRASCGGFNVPVEIKKNSHRDLWSALRRQLIDKYTASRATSGYGIYLVLWFGASETKTPPDGNRPDTPEALKKRLEQDLGGRARCH